MRSDNQSYKAVALKSTVKKWRSKVNIKCTSKLLSLNCYLVLPAGLDINCNPSLNYSAATPSMTQLLPFLLFLPHWSNSVTCCSLPSPLLELLQICWSEKCFVNRAQLNTATLWCRHEELRGACCPTDRPSLSKLVLRDRTEPLQTTNTDSVKVCNFKNIKSSPLKQFSCNNYFVLLIT